MNAQANFKAKAPAIMAELMKEFDLEDFQAAGIAGNGGHESLGFTVLHEIGQPPGKGGYGWFQWSGSRRQSFLWWCQTHHLDWHSDEANISYLIHDLSGPYRRAITALRHCATVQEASDSFERIYEAAGVPALESRREWALIALDAYRSSKATA